MPTPRGVAIAAPRPTVLLFDIDGTLLTCGGAGRLAMKAAFEHVVGREDVCDFPFGGRTDRGIVREGLSVAGVVVTEVLIDEVLDHYLDRLPAALAASTGYRVMPGVDALLDRLSVAPQLAVGLGTGNVERGARLKLDMASLGVRFEFGGFGDDHENRRELLERGIERGAARLGASRAGTRTVVIGDTPRDVAAARAIGVEVMAVRTGFAPPGAWERIAPDLLVDDLNDPGVLSFLLTGERLAAP